MQKRSTKMKKELFNISKNLSVLYVEDDDETREQYEKIFKVLFKNVKSAENGSDALKYYNEENYDLVITDLTMPIMDGITLIGEILKLNSKQHIIIMTAHNTGQNLRSSIDFQIDGILLKPVAVDKLFQLLYKVCVVIENEKKDNTKCSEDKKVQTLLTDDNQVLLLVMIDKFHDIAKQFGNNAKESISTTVSQHLLFFGIENPGCFVKLDKGVIIYVVDKDYLKNIMESLQDFSQRHNSLIAEFDNLKIHLTLSYGIVVPSKTRDIKKDSCKIILEYIDHVLFDIDSHEEDIFIVDMDSDLLEERKIESLKHLEATIGVLEQESMVPFYQPIIDLHTKEVVSYEIYYRIKHENKYILPEFFVQMCEKAGIIEKISKSVYDKAFNCLSTSNYSIHINLNVANLKDDMMKNYLVELSLKYKINNNRIILNIVDSELLKGKSIETLIEFKKLGFKVLLKDFATTNINIDLLTILEPEYIKIKQSMIERSLVEPKVKKIISFLINLAKDLDIKSIIIGVESKEFLDEGASLGFDYAQGYLLGKPADKIIKK